MEDGDGGGVESTRVFRIGLGSLSRTQSLATRIFMRSPELERGVSKPAAVRGALRACVRSWCKMDAVTLEGAAATVADKTGGRDRHYQLLDSLRRPKTNRRFIERILEGASAIQTISLDEDNADAYNP